MCVRMYVCGVCGVCVDVGRRVVAKEKKSNVRRAVKKSEGKKGERCIVSAPLDYEGERDREGMEAGR